MENLMSGVQTAFIDWDQFKTSGYQKIIFIQLRSLVHFLFFFAAYQLFLQTISKNFLKKTLFYKKFLMTMA